MWKISWVHMMIMMNMMMIITMGQSLGLNMLCQNMPGTLLHVSLMGFTQTPFMRVCRVGDGGG